jgi:hypothetical protein
MDPPSAEYGAQDPGHRRHHSTGGSCHCRRSAPEALRDGLCVHHEQTKFFVLFVAEHRRNRSGVRVSALCQPLTARTAASEHCPTQGGPREPRRAAGSAATHGIGGGAWATCSAVREEASRESELKPIQTSARWPDCSTITVDCHHHSTQQFGWRLGYVAQRCVSSTTCCGSLWRARSPTPSCSRACLQARSHATLPSRCCSHDHTPHR